MLLKGMMTLMTMMMMVLWSTVDGREQEKRKEREEKRREEKREGETPTNAPPELITLHTHRSLANHSTHTPTTVRST
jgi:hypothetical protein